METQCIYCKLPLSSSLSYEKCNHKSCTSCILSIIFHNHLDAFQNKDSIELTCQICNEGKLSLSIAQLISMLEQDSSPLLKLDFFCVEHSIPTNGFCEQCNRFICNFCAEQHNGHKMNKEISMTYKNDNFSFRSVSTETDSKMKLPFKYHSFSQFKEHLTKSFGNFEKKYEENNNNIISHIDKMIEELNNYKQELINNKAKRIAREKNVITLFKLFYQKFYSDIYQSFSSKDYKALENICSSINRQFVSIDIYHISPIIEDLDILHEQITGYLSSMKEIKFKYIFPAITHSYKNTQTLIGHSDIINCVCLLANGDVASGGRDSVIRIWKKTIGYENSLTLEGHTGWISNLLLLNNHHLLSGSYDGTLKIWDTFNNFANTHTLPGHTSWVSSSLQFPNGIIISASFDNTIIVRSNKNYKTKEILREHTFGIFALVGLPNNWFASGGGDKTIKIWNTELTVERNLKGHNSTVNCLALLKDTNLIASGSNDKTIKIWNYIEGECITTIKAHNDGVTSLSVFKDGRLISCAVDNLIKIWDNENNFNCTHILKGHSNVVNALLLLDQHNILSASADKLMNIWSEEKNFSVSGYE